MINISEHDTRFTAILPTQIRRRKMSESFTPTPEEVEIPVATDPDAPVDTTPADTPDDAEDVPTNNPPDGEDEA